MNRRVSFRPEAEAETLERETGMTAGDLASAPSSVQNWMRQSNALPKTRCNFRSRKEKRGAPSSIGFRTP